ncbi:TerC family protein [Ureibacillus sp. MALMAid1270]|uniref:TerC family protein n=1 Tax=Ureibacillus sp. MALMAid1270 TaxID=3411629 RepID=UPI003BA5B345
MDLTLFLQYGGVLLVLIVLEGLLSADNALVLAVMAKGLPKELQKKALDIGLALAFVFRIGAIFVISLLFGVWQVQAIGAAYLLFIAIKHFMKKDHEEVEVKQKSFKATVAQIALADIAFAVDSILAAVALVIALPATTFGHIGGIDTAQFILIVLGALAGLIVIRFASALFIRLLTDRPALESAAMLIVGWVGVKLLMHTLAHDAIHVIPHSFVEGPIWNSIFWVVMLSIAIIGWFASGKKKTETATDHK